jgi:hypothetical protein
MFDDDSYYVTDEEIMGVAQVMTEFLAAINPNIDKGLTFPIVLDMLHDGLDETNWADWAAQIRETANPGLSKETH